MPRSSQHLVRFGRELRRLLRDRSSGAAEIAVRAAELMALGRELEFSENRREQVALRIVRAHPAMGSVWNAVQSDDPLAFARTIRASARATIRRARSELPRRVRVLTLSYSSTVVSVVGRRGHTVTVAESLPGGEGRKTSRLLKRSGTDTRIIPDAAMAGAARQADFAVVGADAITPDIIVNKIGTRILALACRDAGIPLHVVADSSKLVPGDWPLPDEGPDEIFETVPRELLSTVFCDPVEQGEE